MYQFTISREKKYFLLPASPTPNGRMHLGHIAGPYLKMDLLRRKIQRGGGTALLVSGSDVYESHIEIKATQLNISHEEVCNKFHALIVKDFEALNIEFDLFINPLEEIYKERFALREKELLQNLIDSGNVIAKEETFIYDPVHKRYLAGCWIKGDCPTCGSATSSYLCENCGMHYRPIEIFQTKNYPDAELINSSSLYLKFDTEKINDLIKTVNGGSFVRILEKYIELQGPYMRLTTPQESGVEWPVHANEKQVIFSYLANLLAYIFFADICLENFQLSENPLSKNSTYTSIVSFGIDTVLPFTAGLMAVGETLTDYKSFDYYIPNFLYHLNGEKFSTSRGNVIWGNDIVNIANIQSDVVRYYLTKQNPEAEVKDFVVEDFIELVNSELCEKHNTAIKTACSKAFAGNSLDDSLFKELESSIIQQNSCLAPPVFNFAHTIKPIENWVMRYNEWTEENKNKFSYWWLKGYALLSYPVMPTISKSLWESLSGKREISLSNFFNDDKLQNELECVNYFNKISYESMEKCIPKKVRHT